MNKAGAATLQMDGSTPHRSRRRPPPADDLDPARGIVWAALASLVFWGLVLLT